MFSVFQMLIQRSSPSPNGPTKVAGKGYGSDATEASPGFEPIAKSL